MNFTSMIELELDFSEEDVEFADRSALKKLADEIEQVISRLVQSFNVGNAIKSGVPVAIIGETNAGKSTLLNVLLNEDKAIVSDIHGQHAMLLRILLVLEELLSGLLILPESGRLMTRSKV
ncbi:hypothetical protein KUBF_46400 [Bacteroides finegoldii]|nr:hypothetical protein KUBF_46400 [Bacteroides finegoldii]